jgi:hypothetical protein
MAAPRARLPGTSTKPALVVVGVTERDVLARYIRFRVWTAVSCTVAVLVLFAPTLGTWFSGGPAAGGSPAEVTGIWSFWEVIFYVPGCGDCGVTSKVAGPPIGYIGGLERGLGWLVFVAFAFTVVCLLLTAAYGGWVTALAAAIGSAGVFAATMLLAFAGRADQQGYSGPASYNPGAAILFELLAAVAVLLWACYVMSVARRYWRRDRDGELEAVAGLAPEPAPTRPVRQLPAADISGYVALFYWVAVTLVLLLLIACAGTSPGSG